MDVAEVDVVEEDVEVVVEDVEVVVEDVAWVEVEDVAWVEVVVAEAWVWDVVAADQGDGQNKEVNIGEDIVIATVVEVMDMLMGILGGGMTLTTIMIYRLSTLQGTHVKEIV